MERVSQDQSERTVWSTRDTFRGVVDASDHMGYIVLEMHLRRMEGSQNKVTGRTWQPSRIIYAKMKQ